MGGLYGVALGGAFFGESMFHRVTDASKVALSALVERLRARGFALLDTQWVTGHLAQFGAIEMPRRRYLRMLDEALKVDATFTEVWARATASAPRERSAPAKRRGERVGESEGRSPSVTNGRCRAR